MYLVVITDEKREIELSDFLRNVSSAVSTNDDEQKR